MAKDKNKVPVKKTAKKSTVRKTKVDWLEVRKEYLSDDTTSYRLLAKKYGVSKETLQKRATREGWPDLRQDLAEKAFNNFTEKLLDEKSNAQSRHLQHYQNLQALANNSIQDFAERSFERDRKGRLILINDKDGNPQPIPKPLNTFELEKLAKTLKIAIDGERIVLGLPTSVSALSDADGNDAFTGFASLMKAADKALDDIGETVE